jgi:hypothetical protein
MLVFFAARPAGLDIGELTVAAIGCSAGSNLSQTSCGVDLSGGVALNLGLVRCLNARSAFRVDLKAAANAIDFAKASLGAERTKDILLEECYPS